MAFGQVEFLKKIEPPQGEKEEEEKEKEADGGGREGVSSSPFPPSSEAFNAEFFRMYQGVMSQKLKEHMSRRDKAAGEFLGPFKSQLSDIEAHETNAQSYGVSW